MKRTSVFASAIPVAGFCVVLWIVHATAFAPKDPVFDGGYVVSPGTYQYVTTQQAWKLGPQRVTWAGTDDYLVFTDDPKPDQRLLWVPSGSTFYKADGGYWLKR